MKSGTFVDLLWFGGKIMVAPIIFVLSLMVLNLIFNIIAITLFKLNKKIVMIYFLILSLIYLYFYAFLGAFYYKVYDYYSSLFGVKWIFYLISLFGTAIIFKHAQKEIKQSKSKLGVSLNSFSFESWEFYNLNDLVEIATITAFRWVGIISTSFLIFTFFPELIEKLFNDFPNYFAVF